MRHGTTINLRISTELDQQLIQLNAEIGFRNLSQTIRYFIEQGIKSHNILKKLRENPELNKQVYEEWKERLEKLSNNMAKEQAFGEIGEDDLDTIMKYSYLENEKRGKINDESVRDMELLRKMNNKINELQEKVIQQEENREENFEEIQRLLILKDKLFRK